MRINSPKIRGTQFLKLLTINQQLQKKPKQWKMIEGPLVISENHYGNEQTNPYIVELIGLLIFLFKVVDVVSKEFLDLDWHRWT